MTEKNTAKTETTTDENGVVTDANGIVDIDASIVNSKKRAAEARAGRGKQVSAVLDADELAALTEFRFNNRIERVSDIVRAAVLAHIGYEAA